MELDRKKIVIAIIVLIFVGIGAWFFLILGGEEREDIVETTRNLFPFGQVTTSNIDNGDGDSQATIGNDSVTIQDTEVDEDLVQEPRLRQVSNFPTGGFVPFIRINEKDIIETEVDEEGVVTEVARIVKTEDQHVRYSTIKDATVYESYVDPYTIDEEKIVDNFIPNAEYAHFSPNGERVLFQYWNKKDRVPESYLARIDKIEFTIPPCPFEFNPVILGDDRADIIGLHTFLNRNAQTRVARTGINSPGNESSLVNETTITSIKNFQSLYQIEIDGAIGPGTREKMEEICNNQERTQAEKEFNERTEKYRIFGFFLPQNIIDISLNTIGDKMFYLQKDNQGVIGIVRNLLDESKETIFESPFTEWKTQWSNESNIELSTKSSYVADGYSYTLNPSTGRYFKSLPERKGLLTNTSPDNAKILIMESTDNGILLSIFDRTLNASQPLTLQTFPEKCTWASNSVEIYCAVPDSLSYGNQYPDIWYQGIETYADSIWKINAETLQESLVSNLPADFSQSIDIENIQRDPKDEYLYFLDKNTEFLWSYRLIDF